MLDNNNLPKTIVVGILRQWGGYLNIFQYHSMVKAKASHRSNNCAIVIALLFSLIVILSARSPRSLYPYHKNNMSS